MKTVLILSQPNDLHAAAVTEALTRRGAEAILWHTSDFPSRATETVSFVGKQRSVRLRGLELDVSEQSIHTVWNRRPTFVLDGLPLHPADRPFVEMGCETFRRALFDTLAPRAFWVNPQHAITRTSKLRQHQAALDVGLEVPDTLYTNDPKEIRTFLREHPGQVIYKPLNMTAWRDDERYYMPFTSALTEEQLVADELLQAVPGIYQVRVPKAYELRVTMMGRRAFTARLHSQETQGGRLDWRRAQEELRMEPFELPAEIATQCFELMRKLDIVFGCFDLIVRPDGRYVFLEVNQAGQFLFVEDATGLPLLDAFTEFLLQGSVDFDWSPDRVTLRYPEVKDAALQRLRTSFERHVAEPEGTWYEGSRVQLPFASSA
ncbi:MvdC/MvdD family ATP grasp protein [Archangium lansingense]|uniref:MvdC/MvdD family ATP grasp protein n=1 Tax=Archangium lansingense TaxID=2995310 RepID=UPI003B783F0B